MSRAIGIDLGGTNIKAVVVEPAGRVLEQRTQAARDWAREIPRLVAELGPADFVGISCPGLPAADRRCAAVVPGKLAGIEGLDWTKHLGRPSIVPVLNDAHAALLGEAWLGAARGMRNVILLTLGTGVGGAILIHGELYSGHIGRAGHLGWTTLDADGTPNVVGMPGALEDAIGEQTIVARGFPTTAQLVEAYRRGDAEAACVWLKSVRALACGIASFINVLDPEAVIIGGGIARAGDALFEPLEKFLEQFEWRPAGHRAWIRPAQLGEFAGALGAARYAMQRTS